MNTIGFTMKEKSVRYTGLLFVVFIHDHNKKKNNCLHALMNGYLDFDI